MLIKCDQCQALVINGVPCHEIGCPLDYINLFTGNFYIKECEWCGSDFEPDFKDQGFCDESCAEIYGG